MSRIRVPVCVGEKDRTELGKKKKIVVVVRCKKVMQKRLNFFSEKSGGGVFPKGR